MGGDSHLLDSILAEKSPSERSLKFRFFLLAVTFKHASFQTLWWNIFLYGLESILHIYPVAYPILARGSTIEASFQDLESIFPFSPLLHSLTSLVSVIFFFSFVVIAMAFCIISFFLCLNETKNIIYLHYALDPRYHLVLIPIIAACFRFSMSIIFFTSRSTTVMIVLSIIFNIVLIPYLFIVCIMNYTNNNSFSKPNIAHAQWFSCLSLYYPIYLFGHSYAGFCSFSLLTHFGIMVLVVSSISSLFMGIFTLHTLPFLHFMGNQVFAARMFLSAFFGFFAAFAVFDHIIYPNFVYALIPLFSIIFYSMTSHYVSQKKQVIQSLLNSAFHNPSLVMNESFINSTFSSIGSNANLQLCIKEIILSSKHSDLLDKLLMISLKTYPQENWYFSLCPFLYVLFLTPNNTIYKFFLHLLSLNQFGFQIEYSLFQFVYFWMMASKVESPIIFSEINEYREKVLEYLISRRDFWDSSLSANYPSYANSLIKMADSFRIIENKIEELQVMFPYSPTILYESSLFYHDFTNGYKKSNYYFKRAQTIAEYSSIHVSREMWDSYELFFARNSDLTKQQKKNNDIYSVLSFIDYSSLLTRKGVSLNVKDHYFSTLTHQYTVNANVKPINPKYDNSKMYCLYSCFFCFVFSFWLFFYLHFKDFRSRERDHNRMLNILELIEQTTEMNYIVSFATQSINSFLLNGNHQKWSYDQNDLFCFLSNISSVLLNLIDNYYYNYTKITPFIITGLCQDSENNCSIHFFYSSIHHYLLMLSEANSLSIGFDKEQEFVFSQLLQQISIIMDRIYSGLIDYQNRNLLNSINDIKVSFLVIITLELLFFLIMSMTFWKLLESMHQSIFSVIGTCQPPIAKKLMVKFNKVINFYHEYPKVEDTLHQMNIGILMLLVIFPLVLYQAFIIIRVYKLKLIKLSSQKFNNEIPFTNSSSKIFSLSIFMAQNISSRGIICLNDIIYMYYVKDMQVIKERTRIRAIYKIVFLRRYRIFNFISLWASFLLHFIFIKRALYEFGLIKTGKNVIKEIPQNAIQSNPVMKKLLSYNGLSSKDVYKYQEDLQKMPEDFENIEILCIQDSQWDDDVPNFPLQFVSLLELHDRLYSLFPSQIKTIDSFFNRKKTSVVLCNMKDLVYELRFDSSYIFLIIINDSERLYHHLQTEIENRLVESIEKIQLNRLDMKNIKWREIILIEFHGKNIVNNISNLLNEFKNLDIIDFQTNRLCLVASDRSIVKSVLSHIHNYIETIKCIVHEVDSLYSYSVMHSSKEYIMKRKQLFIPFDSLILAIKYIPLGSIYYTQNFISENEDNYQRTVINGLTLYY